jgi:MOSC domain-containing protein YiiM
MLMAARSEQPLTPATATKPMSRSRAHRQQRRLRAIQRGLDSAAPVPAAGAALLRLGRRARALLTTGGEQPGAESPAPLPEVACVVRSCFHRASDEERAATGWDAATGRFARERVAALSLSSDPNAPGLHPYAASDGSGAPPERGLMCQTAEAYEKLRAGLPQCAGQLSAERPGSAEDLFVDGIAAWELCIGDVFTKAGEGAGEGPMLQVSSPRRPCEQWNQVHAERAFLDGTALMGTPPQRLRLADGSLCDETEGNVRHFCLRNTLGGFFFRVQRGGELRVGDELVRQTRWPIRFSLLVSLACVR